MTDRELMQQALEALMDAQLHNYALKHKETNDLIAALRERLAQPQRTHWEGCEEVHPECKKRKEVDDFKERLAQAIEDMPFGDTSRSFAIFVRNFK